LPPTLSQIPDNQAPIPDALLRVLNELTEKQKTKFPVKKHF
jgi:hypothetical protein